MSGIDVAIVGATGLVGRQMLRILEQRRFPVSSLRLFASEQSAGRKLFFGEEEIEVKPLDSYSFDKVNLVLNATGVEVSRQFSPIAVSKGALVIDNSPAFRMDPSVPLVIPEVNPEDLKNHKGLVANPNCSTIQMLVALTPLHRVNPIKRIIVSTYQSVSGMGREAIEELTNQTRLLLENKPVIPHVYPHQIAFNLFPHIDLFLEDGYTKEEHKMVDETRKIWHSPALPISATCVRVPVYIGHSEAIWAEFSKPISAEEARRILAKAPMVRVQDEPSMNLYPTPWAIAGTDYVYVGRIREDKALPNGLSLWVVADNLRKGAALNAIQIAELLLKWKWL